ncbi:MAG TPA: sigma-70 factor domain-containing protein, partial [Ilumatobacteraceae bacterium]|nr:sigma-70 factor domain-containing protein [Ilumatobacteraceae bacterium]
MGAESATGSESDAVASAQPVPFAGVDVDEWEALVGRGRSTGAVHAEEIAHVLRHIELSGDVLTQVQSTMSDEGIEIHDEVDHIADDTPSGGARRIVVENEPITAPADHDEQLLSRGRGRRTRKAGPKGDNSTSDTVRLYLREIGQVDLLTVEDERRLAQLIEEGKIAAARIDEMADSSALA